MKLKLTLLILSLTFMLPLAASTGPVNLERFINNIQKDSAYCFKLKDKTNSVQSLLDQNLLILTKITSEGKVDVDLDQVSNSPNLGRYLEVLELVNEIIYQRDKLKTMSSSDKKAYLKRKGEGTVDNTLSKVENFLKTQEFKSLSPRLRSDMYYIYNTLAGQVAGTLLSADYGRRSYYAIRQAIEEDPTNFAPIKTLAVIIVNFAKKGRIKRGIATGKLGLKWKDNGLSLESQAKESLASLEQFKGQGITISVPNQVFDKDSDIDQIQLVERSIETWLIPELEKIVE